MTHDPDTPPPEGRDAARARGPHPDGSRPGPETPDAARPDPGPAGGSGTDLSAAEDARPADMAYYRVPDRSGAMMFLGTVAIPLAVVVLVVVVVVVML